jgi:hypothetical protein
MLVEIGADPGAEVSGNGDFLLIERGDCGFDDLLDAFAPREQAVGCGELLLLRMTFATPAAVSLLSTKAMN